MSPGREQLKAGELTERIDAVLLGWDASEYGRRLWDNDVTLWAEEDTPEIANRLGWLDAPSLPVHADLADEFDDVVLLGMGGSSLAPEVFAAVLDSSGPRLSVLDSTHPAAVERIWQTVDVDRTLFVVASKSGGTLETLSLFRYFWAVVGASSDTPGDQFVAITDPGSGLEQLATDRKFRAVYRADPNVGGRYSALTAFGQVPGRMIGIDVDALLASAADMAQRCGPAVPAIENPGLVFGAFLGVASQQGRDKLTIVCSESLSAFPVWLEQLVAESTGKDGVGVLPVAGEALGDPDVYGSDRVFVRYGLAGDADLAGLDEGLSATGAPVISFTLDTLSDLGAEIFRAEVATAAAASVLGIHPFDQPDVQAAKAAAQQAMAAAQEAKETAKSLEPLSGTAAQVAIRELLSEAQSPNYVAIMAYVPQTAETEDLLSSAQQLIRQRHHTATTVGFGPRFLHSTGQYHKGGANSGLFIQILDRVSAGQQAPDLLVPETDFSFGQLISAQATGDAQALVDKGRRVIRIMVDHMAEFLEWLDT